MDMGSSDMGGGMDMGSGDMGGMNMGDMGGCSTSMLWNWVSPKGTTDIPLTSYRT